MDGWVVNDTIDERTGSGECAATRIAAEVCFVQS